MDLDGRAGQCSLLLGGETRQRHAGLAGAILDRLELSVQAVDLEHGVDQLLAQRGRFVGRERALQPAGQVGLARLGLAELDPRGDVALLELIVGGHGLGAVVSR